MVERKSDGIHSGHVRLVGGAWMRVGRRVIKLLQENKKEKKQAQEKKKTVRTAACFIGGVFTRSCAARVGVGQRSGSRSKAGPASSESQEPSCPSAASAGSCTPRLP